jgi:heme A synthase
MSFLVVCGIAVQMALGVILAYAALPRAAQTLHLTVATMLVCVEFMTLLMLREEIPSSPEGVLPRAPVLHSGLADQQGV